MMPSATVEHLLRKAKQQLSKTSDSPALDSEILFRHITNYSTTELIRESESKVSDINEPKEGILVTGLPNNTDYSDSALLKMVKDFQEWRKVRMIGSAAIASCYIASAKADVYKEFGTYLWDVAAGAAIVNAAGGKAEITNYRDNYQVDVHFSNSKIID